MKRHLLLLIVALFPILANGEDVTYDFPLQFIDETGKIIADGTTLDLTKIEVDDLFGDMKIPANISVKNISDEIVQGGGSYTIHTISNGKFQTCFPINCMVQFTAGTYSTGSDVFQSGHLRKMQTEWLPESEGVCIVSFQLQTFRRVGNNYFPDKDGPTITMRFATDENLIVRDWHTITYIVDGEVYKSYEVETGFPVTPEPAPTKEGYTFSGWSEIPAIMPSHNVTVTGSFVKNYTLTYKVDGQVYKTYSIAYGTDITPEPAPTKEGYTFSGWSGLPETMPAHDVVVTGSFVINSYTLTYKVDNQVYKTKSVTYGSTITPEPAPTKEGNTFSGWSEIPATMPAHDVTVTGSFAINYYTLTYKVEVSVYKTLSVKYGSALTPIAAPTKEGYTFSGWSGLPATMPAHDVVVTGSFSINSYTLTYKVGGSIYKTFSVEYGTALTPEPAPVKKGMTFSGWSEVPESMPARDVTITGTFSWSKETVDGVIYQVTDTLNNYVSVIGTEGTNKEITILTEVEIGGDVYSVNSIANGALPGNKTIYVPMGKLLVWLWNKGYNNIKEIGSGRSLAAPEISLVSKTASSLTMSYINDCPEFTEDVKISGTPIKKGENGYNDVTIKGLEPNRYYDGIASLSITCEDVTYVKTYSFKTERLTLTTQQPKVISVGNVIVSANSNLDDEETNVGFEWRRTDWTSEFESNTGTAYLYEGTMEGYIRNLYTEKLWKYRPFYESNSGNRYYGEWVGIDPTNTSYFEPTVHTYAQITVTGNRAEVKGYAMRGTDNVTSQGFYYWPASVASGRRKVNSVPADAIKVLASGNVMTATLEDLEYETEYTYVAFVTTSEGETFFGEAQTFRTSYDPDGIEDVKGTEEVTEVARYDLQGRMIGKPQKGINIIRYSDGTSKKVMIK